jgi:hypothetical protein
VVKQEEVLDLTDGRINLLNKVIIMMQDLNYSPREILHKFHDKGEKAFSKSHLLLPIDSPEEMTDIQRKAWQEAILILDSPSKRIPSTHMIVY